MALSVSSNRSPSREDALHLLVVDDDLLHARLLRANLERPGRFNVAIAGSAADALEQLDRGLVDAVLTDLAMPEMDGLELVRRIRATDASLPVVLMTAHASIDRAVEGIRAGATDFLAKPVNANALVALIERAVAERPVRETLAAQAAQREGASSERFVVGDHPRLDAVRRFAEQVAATPLARVLLTGESGTGKSMLARAIHELSATTGRFVEVNCAALPAHLLESELFGHEKGAFTDAKELRRGLVESADRGTIFLDELGAMPLELQSKLLLFLESREIRRVGGVHPIPVRTRVVAATNEDLRARARERTFRADLLYRLDVASVVLPPLREMPETIPTLARRFVQQLCEELNRPVPVMAERSFDALVGYPWPGNARELRNAVERALIFHGGGVLEVHPPPPDSGGALPGGTASVPMPIGLTLDEVERRYLTAMLELPGGDYAALAARLGISRKTLWEKRRRYGL